MIAFPLGSDELRNHVRRALAEDVGWGDVTTRAMIDPAVQARGVIAYREAGVVAGLPVAAAVYAVLDPAVRWRSLVADGATVVAGATVAEISGPAASLLTGERLALNYLQRLSGVATLTARYAQALAGTGARLVDTRKTTPGLRSLEKYAVRCGGGSNHRHGLSDGVLVKDNHIAILGRQGVGLREAVARVRAAVPHSLRVEVEVDRLDQIEDVLAGGADIILLDNMPPAALAEAVRLVAGRAITEASGGVTLENIRACAEAG
ncbi:MAG TPA: carboxylating nicotinate-nucleotide diphosphorylase, partial [Chloroflexota bacterium]|nr:carboxylating nicotinate-nucleotide diphosphorylase [Chloroflexota bacterium]